uniref:RWD domain-containing protein n=1 Tax=Mesocestoides corti TaxID=53468 RepID=A0A5K3EX98_MESCO
MPVIDLDVFCNHHVPQEMKDSIIQDLEQLAHANSGEPLTFTLIEHLRDNMETYATQLRESKKRSGHSAKEDKTDKKEMLTKAQKRRQLNRLDGTGNLPRGWNWVDVIKHLRQTGPAQTDTSA